MEEPTGTVGARRRTYCVVPPELASKLAPLLRDHYRDDPTVEVITGRPRPRMALVGSARQNGDANGAATAARLPEAARPHASKIAFLQSLTGVHLDADDAAADRLVRRFQAGECEALAELYRRYFDLVYGYARVALKDPYEAENLTQHVFTKVMEALPRYQIRPGSPFRAWLMRITRNAVIDSRNRSGRTVATDPAELGEARGARHSPELASTLTWLGDEQLSAFVDRLPDTQREVLVLRYMLALDFEEAASVLGKSLASVYKHHARALRTLESRLKAVGRRPARPRPQTRRRGRLAVLTRVRPAPVAAARRFALGGPLGSGRRVYAATRWGG